MADNLLEDRNLTTVQARLAGYVLPKDDNYDYLLPNDNEIKKESEWQQYYKDFGQIYNGPTAKRDMAPTTLKLLLNNYNSLLPKQSDELKRSIGEQKSSTQRTLRASSGLLSGAGDAPMTGGSPGGLPSLGSSQSNLGVNASLGKRSAL
jgi:hypothetical protein